MPSIPSIEAVSRNQIESITRTFVLIPTAIDNVAFFYLESSIKLRLKYYPNCIIIIAHLRRNIMNANFILEWIAFLGHLLKFAQIVGISSSMSMVII